MFRNLGFLEVPKVGELVADSIPPKSYAQGLRGGKGKDSSGNIMEGGFGGGGEEYYRDHKLNWGAGGGFTGGSTKIRELQPDAGSKHCDGGGGGSFSIDKNSTFDHVKVDYGKCKIEFIN